MTAIQLQEAQTRLTDLVRSLSPGEDIILMDKGEAVARLSLAGPRQDELRKRKLGTLAGTVVFMAEDFDAPIDEMRELM